MNVCGITGTQLGTSPFNTAMHLSNELIVVIEAPFRAAYICV
ncbi:MAG: hypothetical protein ABSE19_07070 [Candidatus Acidiferrum sp.]